VIAFLVAAAALLAEGGLRAVGVDALLAALLDQEVDQLERRLGLSKPTMATRRASVPATSGASVKRETDAFGKVPSVSCLQHHVVASTRNSRSSRGKVTRTGSS
jgi:hypothetical protein